MALLATEQQQAGSGLVLSARAEDRGAVVTTNVTTGATWKSGFLRDSDGRLVVKVV